MEEITEVFDVTADEVKAVLHFAMQSLEKEPSYDWRPRIDAGHWRPMKI